MLTPSTAEAVSSPLIMFVVPFLFIMVSRILSCCVCRAREGSCVCDDVVTRNAKVKVGQPNSVSVWKLVPKQKYVLYLDWYCQNCKCLWVFTPEGLVLTIFLQVTVCVCSTQALICRRCYVAHVYVFKNG